MVYKRHRTVYNLHAWIQEFFPGRVQARRPENSLKRFVLVLNLFYSLQRGVQWFYYRENYNFPKIQRGPTFSRVGSTFSRGGGGGGDRRGVQMLISIETHITCDFPWEGVRTPYPPLDPHMI